MHHKQRPSVRSRAGDHILLIMRALGYQSWYLFSQCFLFQAGQNPCCINSFSTYSLSHRDSSGLASTLTHGPSELWVSLLRLSTLSPNFFRVLLLHLCSSALCLLFSSLKLLYHLARLTRLLSFPFWSSQHLPLSRFSNFHSLRFPFPLYSDLSASLLLRYCRPACPPACLLD